MDLALCREIPLGIVAGTKDHPRLVEVQWIRIEPKELPRGVTAHVGWSSATEATWRIVVDLLDDRDRLLPDIRENAVVFTGKAGASADTGMHYADLDLGCKSFRTRRYAARVRVSLERVSDQRADATAGPPFQIKVIDGKSRKSLADVAIAAQAYYEDKRLGSEVFLCWTDAEGMCRIGGLKPASISFTTQKDGYGMMLCGMLTHPAPEPKTVELRPAEPIGGVVQDQDGRPITDVEVQVNASSTEVGGMAYLNRIVRTNKDGSWRVNEVPSEADSVSVGLKHAEYASSSALERTITLWQLVDDQTPKHVDRLTKGVSLDGRVVGPNGQPFVRAAITLAPPRRGGFQYGYAGVLTDAAGRFHFGCAEDMRGDKNIGGPTAIYVEASGYAPMMKKLFIEPNVPPLELRLSAGRPVAIRTVDSNGQPLPGASVQLYLLAEDPGNSISLNVDTDEQGRLQVAHVPDGEVRVTVEKKGYLTIKDHVLPGSGAEHTLRMTAGARVQGTVCDAETGQPIPRFSAILRDATNFDIVSFSQSGEFRDGKYGFSPKEKVSIDLWLIVSAPGYKRAKSKAFRLEEGTRQMDLTLEKAPSSSRPIPQTIPSTHVVRGIVLDPNGRPAGGVTVLVCIIWATSATTDTEGKFKMLCSPAGPGGGPSTWHLVARDSAHSLAAVIELDETSTGDLLVRLAPGMVITGRVVDPQGKGVPGVRLLPMLITETGYGQGLVNASKSDPNGYFEIRDLPPAHNYALRATADGYGDGYIEANTKDAVGNRLELKPQVLLPTNLKVSGIVVTSEGKPVAGARVYCLGGTDTYRTATTDAQGRFTLEKICAGSATIDARAGEKDGLRGSVRAKGGDTEVRIVLMDSGSQKAPKSDRVNSREE